ncbi:MAG: D-arabinono-1,4-lactone oxidase, partial [Pirellulaceae bacterium]
AGFFLFASFMARSMSRLFGARPHWGKLCPLEVSELVSLYPRFDNFRTVCNSLDTAGVFRNRWTDALLQADKDTPETS